MTELKLIVAGGREFNDYNPKPFRRVTILTNQPFRSET